MLLIRNIGLLCTPEGSAPLCGQAQGRIRSIPDAAVLLDGESILSVTGNGQQPPCPPDTEILDAEGALATPGLVDCHTHLVFGGWRQGEIPLKLAGAGYLDIHRAGGGILSTVRHTRAAGEEELLARSMGFLKEQLSLGVTTAEIKSGYGLDMDTELKQLNVIRRLNGSQPVETVATYLGAHAVPPEFNGDGDGYIDRIIRSILPQVVRQGLAEYCDIFIEDSVFSAAQGERLLCAAKAMGLGLRVHADEIRPIGGTELAARLHAASAEHLIAVTPEGIRALADGGVIAALLPMTSLYLGKAYAPARAMIDGGAAVAIASDFNPGSCPCLNLQLAMNLAYLGCRMTPQEILSAVTLNAACALGRGERIGSLEKGKQADIVLWNAADLEMLAYRMGSNQVSRVVKKGRMVI